MGRPIVIHADWDPEAAVWVATTNDLKGLVTESETIEALREPENWNPRNRGPEAGIKIHCQWFSKGGRIAESLLRRLPVTSSSRS
jgi:hypothetical protein